MKSGDLVDRQPRFLNAPESWDSLEYSLLGKAEHHEHGPRKIT